MDLTDLIAYRNALTEKLLDLDLKDKDEGEKEDLIARRVPDAFDQAQLDAQRNRAVDDRERRRHSRSALLLALERIEKGEYGVCLDCGESIATGRLKAIPEAERCRGCQERHEDSVVGNAYTDKRTGVLAGEERHSVRFAGASSAAHRAYGLPAISQPKWGPRR